MDAVTTQSPFLPNTAIQYAWDSTSIGYLKTCPRLYQYQMIEGWASRDESVHLRFGTEYHLALHDYDVSRASGIKHADAVHDVVRELLFRTSDWNPDHKVKTRESLLRTVVWYLDQFENDSAITVLLPSGKPAVELSFRFELDWGPQDKAYAKLVADGHTPDGEQIPQPYILSGHLDRVVNFNSEVFVMDHKTTTLALSPYYYAQFEPNNQMTLYSFASKVILNAPIRGVVIRAALVKEDYSEFGIHVTYRTPDQLQEWLKDLRYWFALAEQYAIANHWPMNDTACDKFGGCRFRQICSKSPSVRERFLEGNFTKLPEEERWNPLRAR